jgi:hypothetical protein
VSPANSRETKRPNTSHRARQPIAKMGIAAHYPLTLALLGTTNLAAALARHNAPVLPFFPQTAKTRHSATQVPDVAPVLIFPVSGVALLGEASSQGDR